MFGLVFLGMQSDLLEPIRQGFSHFGEAVCDVSLMGSFCLIVLQLTIFDLDNLEEIQNTLIGGIVL